MYYFVYEVSGYDIKELFQEAQSRWLKPAEVLFILQNHDKYKVTPEPPQQPVSKCRNAFFLFLLNWDRSLSIEVVLTIQCTL